MSAPVSEPAFRYSAFLSYSHRDERWARRLQNALESYRVPLHLAHAQRGVAGRRLSPVFRDRTDLPSATDLGAHIREALQDSANLIVICSPDAGASRWVNEEIRYFRSLGRDDRIFCMIVGGEPNASDLPERESEECFPAALRFLDGPDGPATGPRVEPIAADARPGADGKSNAQLKLIAGLLGVGFDELKQRELRRQQRRLLVVTVASLAGVLVTGTLAISAWFARQDAIRNRDRAEDLISFMLGDFRQQLEPLGKLELLKSVGDKAMAYFESQDARDITNESLLRRAEALRQIGDVRLSLGEFEPALAAFEESLSLSRELSRRSPDNKDWLFALGNAWFWVGYTHWQKGDLDAAAAPMNEYFRAAERLVQLKPDDPRWQLELGYALANLGSLAAARGDGQAAIRYFESGNAIAEKLIQDDPADLGLLLTRIENHSWLASIHQGLGELREAKVLHAKALQFATELLESRPDDRRIQREKVLRQVFLSRVLVSLGELEEAGRVSGDALSAARVLSSVDPENARWQWQLASVMEQEVRVLRARGRCGEAAAVAEAGLAVTRDLAETATDMDLGHLTRLRLLSEKAACLIDAGRLEEADRALLPLLQFPRVPDERSVNVVHYEIVLATGRHLAGQIMAAKGRMDSARQLWTAGLGILSAGQTDPAHRAVRAMLLEDLGRAEEARQLAAELSELGYSEPNFTRQMFGSDPSA